MAAFGVEGCEEVALSRRGMGDLLGGVGGAMRCGFGDLLLLVIEDALTTGRGGGGARRRYLLCVGVTERSEEREVVSLFGWSDSCASEETLSFFSMTIFGSPSTGLSDCIGVGLFCCISSAMEELCSVSNSGFWSRLLFLIVLFEFNLPRIDRISFCRSGEDDDRGGSEVACAVLCSSVLRFSLLCKTAAISSPRECGSSFSSTIGSVGDADAKVCSELSTTGCKSVGKW